jgi:hypothetical protein
MGLSGRLIEVMMHGHTMNTSDITRLQKFDIRSQIEAHNMVQGPITLCEQ